MAIFVNWPEPYLDVHNYTTGGTTRASLEKNPISGLGDAITRKSLQTHERQDEDNFDLNIENL